MVARINTVAFQGIDVQNVDVQVQISNGLPAFTIVGYINSTIRVLLFLILILPLSGCAFPYILASIDPMPSLEYHGNLAQAEMGNPKAQFEVAQTLHNACGWRRGLGWKPECDKKACSYWYHLAARNGVIEAQHTLGRLYRRGDCGVEKNVNKGIEWYRRAADQDYVPAYIDLARIYGEGWGIPQDKVEAMKWYQKAAEAGSQYAEKMLELEQNEKRIEHGRTD